MNSFVFGFLACELLIVALLDLKNGKISNLWPLLNIGLFMIFLVVWPAQYQWDWTRLIFPVGFIVIGFILFLMDIMGAGDSKFLASLFLLIPAEYHFSYAEKLLLVTIIVGSLLLIRTIFINRKKINAYFLSHHWRAIAALVRSRFSYAPVMFLAWMLFGGEMWL